MGDAESGCKEIGVSSGNALLSISERHRLMTKILLCHPLLLDDVGEAYQSMQLVDSLVSLRKAIVAWRHHTDNVNSDRLISDLVRLGYSYDLGRIFVSDIPRDLPTLVLTERTTLADAEKDWWRYFGMSVEEDILSEMSLAKDARTIAALHHAAMQLRK